MASQQSDQCGAQGVRHHPLAESEDGEMWGLEKSRCPIVERRARALGRLQVLQR